MAWVIGVVVVLLVLVIIARRRLRRDATFDAATHHRIDDHTAGNIGRDAANRFGGGPI